MRVGVGDSVFTRAGDPGIVKARHNDTGTLDLEIELPKVQEAARHGYLNGLSPETRQQFYTILDKVKENDDPAARVRDLSLKLGELEQDPRNHVLSRYIKAEMLYIMNSNGIKPTSYTVDETKSR